MAMVKMSGMLEAVNGKLGGEIWREDQCGAHIQAWPRLIDRGPSPKQQKRRNCFSKLIWNYVRKMSRKEAADWQAYANQHPHINKKGETISLTWWSQFIKTNINRCVENKPIIVCPPWKD